MQSDEGEGAVEVKELPSLSRTPPPVLKRRRDRFEENKLITISGAVSDKNLRSVASTYQNFCDIEVQNIFKAP